MAMAVAVAGRRGASRSVVERAVVQERAAEQRATEERGVQHRTAHRPRHTVCVHLAAHGGKNDIRDGQDWVRPAV